MQWNNPSLNTSIEEQDISILQSICTHHFSLSIEQSQSLIFTDTDHLTLRAEEVRLVHTSLVLEDSNDRVIRSGIYLV